MAAHDNGNRVADDHAAPSKRKTPPVLSIARQKLAVGHDTARRPVAPTTGFGGDHGPRLDMGPEPGTGVEAGAVAVGATSAIALSITGRARMRSLR
jgi:hypothetical protein